MKIEEYLYATRITRHYPPSEEKIDNAKYRMDLIRQTVDINQKNYSVFFIESLNKKAEIVPNHGNNSIILDGCLQEAFIMLQAILKHTDSVQQTVVPFSQILRDQALLTGNISALFETECAIEDFSKNSIDSQWLKNDLELLFLQDMFVLLHELGHVLAKEKSSFLIHAREVGEMIVDISVDNYNKNFDSDRAKEEYIDRYGDAQDWDRIIKSQDKHIRQLKENRSHLSDEVGYDQFALTGLLSICKRIGLPRSHALFSSFIALRNIRTINYLKASLNSGKEMFGMNSRVKLLQYRQHLLRDIYRCQVSDDYETASAQLSDLSDEYDKKIDNPLIFDFLPHFQSNVLKLKNDVQQFDLFDRLQIVSDKRAEQGWFKSTGNAHFVKL